MKEKFKRTWHDCPVLIGLLIADLVLLVVSVLMSIVACNRNAIKTETTTETTAEVEEFDFSISEEWRNRIKSWEGFTAEPINDCGFWAVGYGHQVWSIDQPKPHNVTLEEAEWLFEEDLHAYDEYIVAWCEFYEVELTRPIYETLVSFTYQFGWRTGYMYDAGWWGSDLAAYLKGKISFEDFLEEAVLYCKADGVPNDAIRKRRISEAYHLLGKEVK